MELFKVFTGISVAAAEIQKAMADGEITVKEMCDIVDSTLKAVAGVGLNEIGFKITKQDGKTKVEFVFGNGGQQ